MVMVSYCLCKYSILFLKKKLFLIIIRKSNGLNKNIYLLYICLDIKKKKERKDLFSIRGLVSVILYYKVFFINL